jgi:hypothetical protein
MASHFRVEETNLSTNSDGFLLALFFDREERRHALMRRRASTHFAHLIHVFPTTISFGALVFARLKERAAKETLALLCTNRFKALDNKFVGL